MNDRGVNENDSMMIGINDKMNEIIKRKSKWRYMTSSSWSLMNLGEVNSQKWVDISKFK